MHSFTIAHVCIPSVLHMSGARLVFVKEDSVVQAAMEDLRMPDDPEADRGA
jgi:hypothetical protein